VAFAWEAASAGTGFFAFDGGFEGSAFFAFAEIPFFPSGAASLAWALARTPVFFAAVPALGAAVFFVSVRFAILLRAYKSFVNSAI
jgi:hypothetical protein